MKVAAGTGYTALTFLCPSPGTDALETTAHMPAEHKFAAFAEEVRGNPSAYVNHISGSRVLLVRPGESAGIRGARP